MENFVKRRPAALSAALTLTLLAVSTPALADPPWARGGHGFRHGPPPWAPAHGWRRKHAFERYGYAYRAPRHSYGVRAYDYRY